jgi:hypothetical protein
MSDLCIVCCHFNPAKYKKPVDNLHRFNRLMRYQGVHCLTVELVLDDDASVAEPGRILLRGTRTRNTLWQKETLLNVGIEFALKNYQPKAIAWVDADVIFLSPTWAQDTLKELEYFPVVQMFSDCYRLDHQGVLDAQVRSTGWWWSTSNPQWIDFNYSHPGYAWAARAELFSGGMRLYDRVITGCGDTLMLRSWTGKNIPVPFKDVGPRLAADVCRWAGELDEKLDAARSEVTSSRLGFTMGSIAHMYHGKMKDRGNKERRFILQDFDPVTHVRKDSQGILEWTEEAPAELRDKVSNYFLSRREDC